jgi:uncharacterized DUF497 family protein
VPNLPKKWQNFLGLTLVFIVYTINTMKIEFDQAKSEKNRLERGFSFQLAAQFELETALIRLDVRNNYGEPRFNALGLIDDRLFHMTFTVRGDAIRVISLRKANKREVNYYVLNN